MNLLGNIKTRKIYDKGCRIMKPNILLAGVTGYIGKYLIESIKDEGILYTLSKYPKEKEYQEIIWLEKIFITIMMF